MIKNILALTGLLSLACVTAGAANAQDWDWRHDDRPPRMRVSFSDLDLSRPGDQKRLDRRIRSAVNRVCGDSDVRDLHGMMLQTRCRRDARRSTDVQVALAVRNAHDRQSAAVVSPSRTAIAAVGDKPAVIAH